MRTADGYYLTATVELTYRSSGSFQYPNAVLSPLAQFSSRSAIVFPANGERSTLIPLHRPSSICVASDRLSAITRNSHSPSSPAATLTVSIVVRPAGTFTERSRTAPFSLLKGCVTSTLLRPANSTSLRGALSVSGQMTRHSGFHRATDSPSPSDERADLFPGMSSPVSSFQSCGVIGRFCCGGLRMYQ